MRQMTFVSPFQSPFVNPFPSQVSAAASWWLSGGIAAANCVAAYAPKGAASLAASYSNLANPGTYDAAPGAAPDWDVTNGWKFNGSSHHLTTGIVQSSTAFSVICRFNNVTSGAWLFGHGKASNNSRFAIAPKLSNKIYYCLDGSGSTWIIVNTLITSGVLAIAGTKAYRDGVQETGTMTPVLDDTYGFFIGAINSNGSATSRIAAYVQAISFYDVTLTSTQIGALTTAINLL